MDRPKLRVVTSKLTDIRGIEKQAAQQGLDVERVTLSMASADDRAAFHALQQGHGWTSLPMIFSGERFLGGELELQAWLDVRSAAGRDAWPGIGAVAWTLLGLLPFLLGPVLIAREPGDSAVSLWLLYAALILAFMSGTHWMERVRGESTGLALLCTTLPLLAVWLASLAPLHWYAGAIGVALLVVFGFDFAGWRRGRITGRYLRLRLLATVVAAGSLFLGAGLLV